jgi:two-component system, LytTR family, response regulator
MVIDDEQHAIDLLKTYISKTSLLHLQLATTNPVEAFQHLQKHRPHLIFLDIQMPELDGMQFMRLAGNKSKIILTTAYSEHALEGYEHDIIDYLLKPVLFERFLKAVQKAINLLASPDSNSLAVAKDINEQEEFVFVRTETRNKIIRILLRDIEYIEGMGNYVSIYTTSSRIVTLLTIKELEEKLPPGRFVRIHNSYVVPVNKITVVEGNQLNIGKHRLPIGDIYKKAFLNTIEGHILNIKK